MSTHLQPVSVPRPQPCDRVVFDEPLTVHPGQQLAATLRFEDDGTGPRLVGASARVLSRGDGLAAQQERSLEGEPC